MRDDLKNVELKCTSTFKVKGSNKKILENDVVKWVSFEFAKENLIESQQKSLKIVKKYYKMFVNS